MEATQPSSCKEENASKNQLAVPSATLHSWFSRQVSLTPHAEALVDDSGESLSYAELDGRVSRIAHRLRAEKVGPDVPVGILLGRSVWLPAAVLGVLRAGGAFVPLDPGYPPARMRQTLRGIDARITLADADHAQTALEAGGTVIRLGLSTGDHPSDIPETAADPGAAVDPQHLAAVFHTSGSTGTPKSVACTHAGWANRMEWMQQRHRLEPGDTVLQKSVLTFDDSAVEFLWPLLVGGRVAMMAAGDAHLDPRAVIEAAIRHRAVHLQFVPSLLDVFLDALTEPDAASLRHLRTVGCSGEALPAQLVDRFHRRFGGRVELDNTWGVTEVSIDSTCHPCRPGGTKDTNGAMPIGTAMTGNTVHVLDGALRPVPEGDPGDLYIGGVGLARGYLGDPSRTADVFLPHPTQPGERLYRTGDRGCQRADGVIEFIGRTDDQVKIRGVRIELGEVEVALRSLPSVADAAATTWQSPGEARRLAAYVVAAGAAPLDVTAVRAELREVLPAYAVPDFVGVLPQLPRHANGKTDRKSLPAPASGASATGDAPTTETERILERIWASVLRVDAVGTDTSFFDAGGNSLIAMRLLSRLRRSFEIQVPLKFVFDHPTIRTAARHLETIILAEAGEPAPSGNHLSLPAQTRADER